MYGFENDYDLYPANEGIGDMISDFFERVWDKIKEFGEWVREQAEYIKNRIKYAIEHVLKSREERAAESSKTMADKVEIIKKGVDTIQTNAINCIDKVTAYVTAIKTGGAAISVRDDKSIKEADMGKETGRRLAENMKSMKNMSDISADDRKFVREADSNTNNQTSKDLMKLLSEAKGEISGKNFDKVLTDVKRAIGELKAINDADITALKAAHSAMLEIFGNNNTYGQKWRRIMAFQKLATGEIKTLIGKVVKIYNIGIKCTQALASKVVKGKFNAEGSTMKERATYKKEMRSYNKGYDKDTKKAKITSKNYKNDDGFFYNGEDQVKESAFMDMDAYQAGYEAAYEAAYRDAMEAQEFYDSIPDAFEEFMNEQDDYGYDY